MNSESKHTPGPWEISWEAPRWIIQAECGPWKKALAFLIGDYVSCAADAHLISAAPDMLSYCRLMEANGDPDAAELVARAEGKAS